VGSNQGVLRPSKTYISVFDTTVFSKSTTILLEERDRQKFFPKRQRRLEVQSGTHDQNSDSDNELEDTNHQIVVKFLKAETNSKSENFSDSGPTKDTDTDTETKTVQILIQYKQILFQHQLFKF